MSIRRYTYMIQSEQPLYRNCTVRAIHHFAMRLIIKRLKTWHFLRCCKTAAMPDQHPASVSGRGIHRRTKDQGNRDQENTGLLCYRHCHTLIKRVPPTGTPGDCHCHTIGLVGGQHLAGWICLSHPAGLVRICPGRNSSTADRSADRQYPGDQSGLVQSRQKPAHRIVPQPNSPPCTSRPSTGKAPVSASHFVN